MSGLRVYVAGPINSSGLFVENMRNALHAATMLHQAGHYPFVPNLYLMWQTARTDLMTEAQMMEMDKVWLLQCDAMVRLPGVSKGADQEEAWAAVEGIPVFKRTEEYVGDIYTGVRKLIAEHKAGRLGPRDRDQPPGFVKYDTAAAVGPENWHPKSVYNRLTEWQVEVKEWLVKQPFYPQQAWQPLLGIGEELGELNHAFLKRSQGIRGDATKHREAMKDAVGDIMVYLAGFCEAEDLTLGECLEKAWSEVSKRDWNKNTATGAVDHVGEYLKAADKLSIKPPDGLIEEIKEHIRQYKGLPGPYSDHRSGFGQRYKK